jgi:cold shock CspA family protein
MREATTAPLQARRHGVVVSWDKTHGFIRPLDFGEQRYVFVHRSQLHDCRALKPGTRVEFYMGKSPIDNRRDEAVNVCIAEESK